MNQQEIIALVGALAWVPQIGKWINSYLTKPKVKIVPNKQVEVGFTTLGPIFNLRMILMVERKPIVIEDIQVEISHSDGDCHTFQWMQLNETFSEIIDNSGNKQTIHKDQIPIAIRIEPSLLLEKVIRFQEVAYHERIKDKQSQLVNICDYNEKHEPEDACNRSIKSKERNSLVSVKEQSFWWKEGVYKCSVKIESGTDFRIHNNEFTFALREYDIDILRGNIKLIGEDQDNMIKYRFNIPDEEVQNVSWKWVFTGIVKNYVQHVGDKR